MRKSRVEINDEKSFPYMNFDMDKYKDNFDGKVSYSLGCADKCSDVCVKGCKISGLTWSSGMQWSAGVFAI